MRGFFGGGGQTRGGQGRFGGGEQRLSLEVADGRYEHAVVDAGDEVADVLQSGKRRHGLAIGFVGREQCDDGGPLAGLAVAVGLVPCIAAANDGGTIEAWRETNVSGSGAQNGQFHGHVFSGPNRISGMLGLLCAGKGI